MKYLDYDNNCEYKTLFQFDKVNTWNTTAYDSNKEL